VKFENIDVTKTIEEAKNLLAAEKNLSPALRSVFTVVLMLLQVLLGKVSTNSKNSSKPPSQDPNRKKTSKTKENGKKAGGQEGHAGVCLEPVKNPDEVVKIKCEKKDLPKGKYKNVGYESRQVVNIHIRKKVTEYQAEILEDEQGNRFTAKFPGEVTQKIQYGESIKSHAVYLSQFQLLPYARIQDYFADQMKIPLSAGSIFNFNKEAYRRLEEFDTIAKQKLISSSLLHADETGINVNGTKLWLHNASNDQWVYFYPHKKRGNEAMNEIGILSKFKGVMVHDHWKAYYAYTDCLHSLCNSHHLRELLKVVEVNGHKWAQEMHDLLLEINLATKESDGILKPKIAQEYKERYRQILARGDIESPEPPPREKGKRPPKKEKHRNLLERLRNFESDALRFMENTIVPFTNNMGENDIRMTKVQQKISGCFRSIEGAKIFCRVRSYLLTCQKNALSPTEAIALLFSGKLPDFCH
jgi:transposase